MAQCGWKTHDTAPLKNKQKFSLISQRKSEVSWWKYRVLLRAHSRATKEQLQTARSHPTPAPVAILKTRAPWLTIWGAAPQRWQIQILNSHSPDSCFSCRKECRISGDHVPSWNNLPSLRTNLCRSGARVPLYITPSTVCESGWNNSKSYLQTSV